MLDSEGRAVPVDVSFDKIFGNIVHFKPVNNLAPDSVYRLVIPEGALIDYSGKICKNEYVLTILTGNKIIRPLNIVETSPANKEKDVLTDSGIVVTFNQPIQFGEKAENIIIFRRNGKNIDFWTYIRDNRLILQPSGKLVEGVTYVVRIGSKAIRTNDYTYLEDDFEFSFTTKSSGKPGHSSGNPDDSEDSKSSDTSGKDTQNLPETSSGKNGAAGNISGNTDNSGRACFYEGYVYFINANDKQRIYKLGGDGRVIGPLDFDPAQSLCIVDGWIYFINNDKGSIYKIRTDGTEKTRVTDHNALSFYVDGDSIYYVRFINGIQRVLCRIDRIDGKYVVFEYDRNIAPENFYIHEGWIYFLKADFTDLANFMRLFRVRLDGTGLEQVSPEYVTSFDIVGDTLYISAMHVGILKMNLDGTDPELLSSDWAWQIIVSNSWMYYIDQNYSIGKMKLDDSTKKVLLVKGDNDAQIQYINIDIAHEYLVYDIYGADSKTVILKLRD